MPKATHILNTAALKKTLTDQIMGGPIAVYGKEDLDQRLEAAKELGVEVTVREISSDEER